MSSSLIKSKLPAAAASSNMMLSSFREQNQFSSPPPFFPAAGWKNEKFSMDPLTSAPDSNLRQLDMTSRTQNWQFTYSGNKIKTNLGQMLCFCNHFSNTFGANCVNFGQALHFWIDLHRQFLIRRAFDKIQTKQIIDLLQRFDNCLNFLSFWLNSIYNGFFFPIYCESN